MIKNILKTLVIGGGALLVTSCNLETENLAALPPEVALADSSGFRSLVFSAYERVNDFAHYGQQSMIHPEIMADNMDIANRTGRYEQEYLNAVGAHMNRWGVDPGGTTLSNGRYVPINECNFVIDKVDALPEIAATQKQKDRFKGEAYFLRALNYFELLRVYAYEPGREVNGWNAGVILRTTPVAAASDADFRARGTNLEGYQLMEADLLAAISLLPEPSYSNAQFPYRATKLAAKALLAKVYLYWGRYADAADMADQALAYTNGPLTTPANYVAAWVTGKPHPESFFESDITTSDWSSVDGQNNSLHSITSNALGGSQYVAVASPELIAAHEANDVRRTLYDDPSAATQQKYRSRKWSGSTASFLENIPIIRRADILLVAAEAKARSSQEADAIIDVNTLRAARNLPATALTGQALIDLILNERRVELAFEGNRWFDLKRLGMDIPKTAASQQSPLPYSDFRILSRIPIDQVSQNSLLKQNPGY